MSAARETDWLCKCALVLLVRLVYWLEGMEGDGKEDGRMRWGPWVGLGLS